MEDIISIGLKVSTSSNKSSTLDDGFSEILSSHNLPYTCVGHYFQVGEINSVQGWIIHISVVRSQLIDLITKILPLLLENNMPFKIPKDKETAKNLLDGNFGAEKVGKVICIYPEMIDSNLEFINKLVKITKAFKGPAVLTDFCLGGLIYTRYGSFNPILLPDEDGVAQNTIYNYKGDLVKDEYLIPFRLPQGVTWPFDDIASFSELKIPKIIHEIYKPIKNLKTDPRGDVIKALYLHRLWHVKWCVMKKGIKNMWSDDYGRDIPNRLLWQKQLHTNLSDIIPLPKVLDFFEENSVSYLVIEYIKGKALYNHVLSLNKTGQAWFTWQPSDQIKVLDYLLQLILTITNLHERKYVHRDITPANFIVNKQNVLIPIDLELAYYVDDNSTTPPFVLGTNGFMAPEQQAVKTPTTKEDIYGIGATMVVLMAGLNPTILSTSNQEMLFRNLEFFIQNEPMSKIISRCLRHDPDSRPALKDIESKISEYKEFLKNKNKSLCTVEIKSTSHLTSAKITNAIRSLVLSPTLMLDEIWLSPSVHVDAPGRENKAFEILPGLQRGLSGILYLIGRAKQAGVDVSDCEKSYAKSWKHLHITYLNDPSKTLTPGLYSGAAGIALALSTGINADMITDDKYSRSIIEKCLGLRSSIPELASGAAGQAISALQCEKYIDPLIFHQYITKYLEVILSEGTKFLDSAWARKKIASEKLPDSFSSGSTGIIWFLLEFDREHPEPKIRYLANTFLIKLDKHLKSYKQVLKHKGFQKAFLNKQFWESITGLILVYIKAYECYREIKYKIEAEDLLSHFPPYPLQDDFTQELGLTGLGEIYLEAYRVFKTNTWFERATWIVNVLMHTYRNESGTCYWLSNNSVFSTADFMIGNSGIIHFLIRYLYPESVSYRVLN